MLISKAEFQQIDNLLPTRDQQGRILKFSPASLYNNPKNLPLNRYGEGPFCQFRIKADKGLLDSLGVYAIVQDAKEVLYIGKCTRPNSTLGKRFNAGYGTIHPSSCFKGGQSTSCRINHGILEAAQKGKHLTVVFHKCQNGSEASSLKSELIKQLRPPWNINAPW